MTDESPIEQEINTKLLPLILKAEKLLEEIAGENVGFSFFVYLPDSHGHISNRTKPFVIKELITIIRTWEDKDKGSIKHAMQWNLQEGE